MFTFGYKLLHFIFFTEFIIQGVPGVMTNIWTGDRKRQYKSKFFYTQIHFEDYLSGTKVRYRPIKFTVFSYISLKNDFRAKSVEVTIISIKLSTKNVLYISLICCIVLVITLSLPCLNILAPLMPKRCGASEKCIEHSL